MLLFVVCCCLLFVVVCCLMLVDGGRWLVAGVRCLLLVVPFPPFFVVRRLFVVGCWTAVVGCCLLFRFCWLLVVGRVWFVVGC